MIRKAVSTVSLLWLATMFSSGLAFITQIILARQLGVVEFGSFSAALATVNLLAPLAGFGVNGFWLNIFGKEGWDALRWVKPSLLFSSLSTFAVIILIIAWAMLGIHDEQSAFLLIVLSGCVISQTVIEIVNSCFQLEENYFYFSLWQFLQNGLRLIGIAVISFIFIKLTTILVAFIYLVVAFLIMVFCIHPLNRVLRGNIFLRGYGKKTVRFFTSNPEPTITEVFHQAWPFGLTGFFYLIYFQVDIILVKYIVGSEIAGVYNTAFLVISSIYTFPLVIYQKFLLSKIHRWSNYNRDIFYQTYLAGSRLMLLIGLLIMVVIWLLSSWAVYILFGENYSGAVSFLNILALAVPARFLGSSIGSVLSTQHHIVKKNYIIIIAAFINFFLNILFIPVYGAVAAAVTTVITELFVVFTMYMYMRRYVFIVHE